MDWLKKWFNGSYYMLKVGIIGSNFGVKVLLPAFASTKGCCVVAVCAKPSPHLTSFCKKTGFSNIYTDWKTMLRDENLDAVAIAVTPNAQYLIAKTALNQGLNVFAEKPLATTVAQARELLAQAKKKKVTHAVDFTFPEIKAWQKTKAIIDSGKYGALKNISVNWNWLAGDIKAGIASWKTSIKDGGGILSLYFSHGLYYLENFAGQIKNIDTLFTHRKESLNGAETGIDLSITFKNGITGNAHVHGNSRGVPRHQLIFQCEKATIVLENTNAIVDNFTVSVEQGPVKTNIPIVIDKGNPNEDSRVKIAKKSIARFVTASNKGVQTLPSFAEGVRVQELIDMARKGAL